MAIDASGRVRRQLNTFGESGKLMLMTATVEQTQRDLTSMIRVALAGEEVVITEAGQPVAKLTGISPSGGGTDRRAWLDRLRELRQSTKGSKSGRTSEEIIELDRAERAE